MDEDAAIRETFSFALQEEGYDVVCFADGASLLSMTKMRTPACIFLEVRTPDRLGLEILRRLRAEDYPAPIFVTSGQGDIPMAVDAIRSGAVDFIEKPFQCSEVIARVKEAIDPTPKCSSPDLDSKTLDSKAYSIHQPGSDPLTRREREVLVQVVSGASNKEAARVLGISSRTVEDHRASIMRKAGVRSATELIRRVLGGL